MYLIGNGVDIHKIKKTNRMLPQKLAGSLFDIEYNIDAHSDGDIIIHAISNSILGALSLNDIGTYFSDTSRRTKDMDSKIILNRALQEMRSRNYHIHNVDLTIVCEKIIFRNMKERIKECLIELLGTENISVKATRFEQDLELIQVNCSLLLKKDN